MRLTPLGTVFSIATVGIVAIIGGYVGASYHDQITLGVAAMAPGAGAHAAATPSAAAAETLYTCAMHPQVLVSHPGNCPICGMALTPAHTDHASMDGSVIIDPVVIQNMGVRVAPVLEGTLHTMLHTVGTFTEPEQNHTEINLRVSGWIPKLYANQDGMEVNTGDPLFDLYSPEITTAAEEFIGARKSVDSIGPNPDPAIKSSSDSILAAAHHKLELLGLNSDQIDAIAKLDHAPATVTFTSPMHGHITEKMVVEGSAIKAGDKIMKIANRKTMWLQLQIYESQLPLIAVGTMVHAKTASAPGETLDGKIEFIYPHLDMMTRTAMVRVVFPNHDHRIHEGMYATADIDTAGTQSTLLIPREAILDSGTRQIVFTSDGPSKGGAHFTPHTVVTGQTGHLEGAMQQDSGDNLVQILSGLDDKDTVVTSGQFLLDSESRMQEAIQKHRAQLLLASTNLSPKPPMETPVATSQRDGMMPRSNAHTNTDLIAAAYLDLATTLGKVQTDSTAIDPVPLINALHSLVDSHPAAEIQPLAQSALDSATDLVHQPIDAQREKFKPLSKVITALLEKSPPALSAPLHHYQCPMTKGEWLQLSDTMANPFYAGSDMKSCGNLVDDIPAVTPSTMNAGNVK